MLYCIDNDWNTFSGSDVSDGDFIVMSGGTPGWTDLGLSGGEMIYWDGSGWESIDAGSDGDILTTDGSSVYWDSAPEGTLPDGGNTGDMLYWDGDAWSLIDASDATSGDVLRFDASGPYWDTPSTC